VSIDCKATVEIGEYSRGGKTRGDHKADDQDMGCDEKRTPFGVVDEDTGELHLIFGGSAKTSDFIADCLSEWWQRLPPTATPKSPNPSLSPPPSRPLFINELNLRAVGAGHY